MKSNGVGALWIVVVGGLVAACTGQAVGDGKTAGDPFGIASGLQGGKTDAPPDGKAPATQPTTPAAPTGTGTSAAGPSAPPSSGSKEACSSFDSGNPTCNTCAQSKCCDGIGACFANTSCANLNGCLSYCWDASCESACYQQYPGGSTLFQKAAECVRTSCAASCGGGGGG